MKNTLLKTIILFLLAIPFKSDAQKYRKMLGDSSVWYETHIFEGAYTKVYIAYGDSLINNVHYKVVPCGNSSWQISAFLREDILARKVYLKRSDSINLAEELLYDFGKNIGDTINVDYFYEGIYVHSEDSDTGYIIDSIKIFPMLGDSIRNFYGHRLSIGSTRNLEWIEGVGSPRGLFTSYNYLDELPSSFTNCKYTDSKHIYKVKIEDLWLSQVIDTACYIYISGMPNIEKNNFSNYPNPFNNKLTIEGKPLQNCKAEVYDIAGKLLETIIMNGNEINFNNNHNGLLLIRIFDKQGIAVGTIKGVKL